MLHLPESADSLAANPLGGRIGADKLRMSFFQVFQLPQKMVIFKIGHSGVIKDVIAVIGLRQEFCQFRDSLFCFHVSLRFVKMFVGHHR